MRGECLTDTACASAIAKQISTTNDRQTASRSAPNDIQSENKKLKLEIDAVIDVSTSLPNMLWLHLIHYAVAF